jgi:transcription termination factor Rho
MNIAELKDKTISELNTVARDLGVQGASGLRKQELIFKIIETQTQNNGLIFGVGVCDEFVISKRYFCQVMPTRVHFAVYILNAFAHSVSRSKMTWWLWCSWWG